MRKRFETLIAMAFVLAACGGGVAETFSEIGSGLDNPATTITAEPTTTEAPTTTLAPTTTTTTTCFIADKEAGIESPCTDEEMFIEFVVTFPYELGGRVDGIAVGNVVEGDFIEMGEIWCGSLELMADEAGEIDPAVKALSMTYATQSRDESGVEVMIALFTAAEAFLCSEVPTEEVAATTTTTRPPATTTTTVAAVENVHYKNCDDVRANGAAPIHRGDPGFQDKFDSDGDGVACE